ncbi:ribonuclease H-like domain-containing protein [Crucibulum laeve]|uniref:Ribonuclease H-like domain-containing protein n=1 Tax=Crucibulum laeve TaxID=68775 RepID=A0A5C3LZU8_9AGAR|nr:ribonuclease H-like domain-containing protein [Crucibulum laeve]
MATQTVLADTIELVCKCLDDILPSNGTTATIAVDLEGDKLCREGTIAIMQLYREQSTTVWLIDVTTLKDLAFDTVNAEGRSLRGVLEDKDIKKIFYDVRNDSDALYHHYSIHIKNPYDLQILELAVRHHSRRQTRFLNGLARVIDQYLRPNAEWKAVKEAGVKLFRPSDGGSYKVFESRPLDPRIAAYCAQDVILLFDLGDVMKRILGHAYDRIWEDRVIAASNARVAETHSSTYRPNGPHKAISPII